MTASEARLTGGAAAAMSSLAEVAGHRGNGHATGTAGDTRVRTRVVIPIGDMGVDATFHAFENLATHEEHFVVQFGPGDDECPLVRVHSECITGDLFGSRRCDCGPQLREAIERLTREGGYLVYLRQEGRGIGLYAKLAAYVLQDQGLDTFEANRHLDFPDDLRDYGPAAAMLRALGVARARLLTNNPQKVDSLRACGLEVAEVIPTGVYANASNLGYLRAKVEHAHHTINLDLGLLEGVTNG